MIADALHQLVDRWRVKASGITNLPEREGRAKAFNECAADLEAVLATVREKPQTPLKLCAGGTHTWTRTTSRWPGPAERCDCGARTWGVQQAEGSAPEPPKGTLSNEDAKHSCPRCEMDLLDCVCPEPAEARVPHEPPATIDNARLIEQAMCISLLLSEAGIGPCTITAGVEEIIRQRDLFKSEAQASRPAPPLDWQPIDSRTPRNDRVFFWIVPKVLGDGRVYADSSGKPIISNHKAYRHEGVWGSWGALSKPTHWMPLPDPPAAVPQAEKEPK